VLCRSARRIALLGRPGGRRVSIERADRSRGPDTGVLDLVREVEDLVVPRRLNNTKAHTPTAGFSGDLEAVLRLRQYGGWGCRPRRPLCLNSASGQRPAAGEGVSVPSAGAAVT
jgi:hypothetical protein